MIVRTWRPPPPAFGDEASKPVRQPDAPESIEKLSEGPVRVVKTSRAKSIALPRRHTIWG